MPKVTIILTSFNHEKFIREAIDSVLGQTFTDFEIIIWDDASTDDSWKIINSYSDSRIKAYRNDKTRRAVYGVNKAISEIAQGEYIAIHHSDDVWEPSKLEKQVDFLDNHPEYGAVFTWAQIIDENGAEKPAKWFIQQNKSRWEWLHQLFTGENHLNHPSILARKICYEVAGLYRSGLAQTADAEMWSRLLLHFEIYVIQEKLTKHRLCSDNTNTSSPIGFTPIRTENEWNVIRSNFLDLATCDDLNHIFPNLKKYKRPSGCHLEFLFSMACLEECDKKSAWAFGLSLLYKLITEPASAAKLKDLYDFDYFDLIKLSGEFDSFGIKASRLVSEKDGQIDSLNLIICDRDKSISLLHQTVSTRDANVSRLNEALREQDNRIQQKDELLRNRDAQIKQKEAELTKLSATLQGKEAELTKLSATLQGKEAELTKLSATLQGKEAELTKLSATLQKKEAGHAAQIHRANQQLSEAQTLLHRVLSSLSWKITSPLRWVRRNLNPYASMFAIPLPASPKDIGPDIHSRSNDKKTGQPEIPATSQSKAAGLAKRTQQTNQQLDESQVLLNRILSSVSWKVTAPMRWTRRKLNPYPSRFDLRLPNSPKDIPAVIQPDEALNLLNWILTSASWKITAPLRWVRRNLNFYPSRFDLGPLPSSTEDIHISLCLRNTPLTDDFVPLFEGDPLEDKPVKLICFYLPQFHSIPENDEWWGKGFTEWTNVRPARPQFVGHYQPHVPYDLGYYNLLNPEVQKRQVELAKLYGTSGFCFYFYWFAGKRLLETPLQNYLKDRSLDLPFCLCWANENWTRCWDGQDCDVLMAQDHSLEDDVAFIAHVSQYMRDTRYIRIDGKPLLLVYRPGLLPSAKDTANRWRDWCRANGPGEIYLAYTQSFEKVDPAEYGFDAAIEFPPNNSSPPNITDSVKPLNDDFQCVVYDWRIFVERSEQYEQPAYKLFRGVCPSWDNTPRRKNGGAVFYNNSPSLYGRWLANAIKDTQLHHIRKDEQMVFINAWNEWAEGAHLEPDTRYGYAYLQETRDALINTNSIDSGNSILLVTHDCHPHGAQFLILEMARQFKKMGIHVFSVALDGGMFLEDFRQVGLVYNCCGQMTGDLELFLKNLYDQGVRHVISNTVVSGRIISILKEYDFKVMNLIHELPYVINNGGYQDYAQMIARYSDIVVFPSNFVYDHFNQIAAVPNEKVMIRHQGVLRKNPYKGRQQEARRAICEKLGLPFDTRILLSVAHLGKRKGADYFVEIADRVTKNIENLVFIWVGSVENKEVEKEVTDRIASLSLGDKVLLVGFDRDPMAYYAAASVYVLASLEDPFPNVVLESAEVGVPVVAFKDRTGAGEFIEKHGGRLAAYPDVDDFANHVIHFLKTENRNIDKEYPPIGSLRQYILDLLHELTGKPRISVVVPNYNYAGYITERLNSIVHQSYPIYELIVLDDASTDNSTEIIKNYLETIDIDHWLIKNTENSGSVFKQWIKGTSLCRGDVLWIAEADDLSDPSFLAELASAFKEPRMVMAYTQSRQINENGCVMSDNYLNYTNDVSIERWHRDYVAEGMDEIREAMCIKNTIPNVSAVLFRVEALIKAFSEIGDGLFEHQVGGDWMVYLHVLKQGLICFRQQSLNSHRRHTRSVTKSVSHLNEVKQMQTKAQAISCPSASIIKKSEDYLVYLHDYFGIEKNQENSEIENLVAGQSSLPRLIAFYLPQYHPIAENDRWWGKGFTEWTNVTNSQPLFSGHYQPHLPADMGFYDLRLSETREAQAELARQHGIFGFCYYHYWFSGKRLLERPFNEVLTSGKPDFPFCLCWANETWSRRWLGEEKDILMKQTYSKADDLNHIRWLLKAFSDPRYIKIQERPIFLIYRPRDLPDPSNTVEVFRNECLRNGLPDPYLIGVDAHCPGYDFREIGFDETLVFLPQLGVLPDFMDDSVKQSKLIQNMKFGIKSGKYKIYDYADAMDAMMARKRDFPFIPSVFVGWDNTPRRGENGIIMLNASPEAFERRLAEIIKSVSQKSQDGAPVFINAWNEWAEGNHLEPDIKNGLGFLEAVKRVCHSRLKE